MKATSQMVMLIGVLLAACSTTAVPVVGRFAPSEPTVASEPIDSSPTATPPVTIEVAPQPFYIEDWCRQFDSPGGWYLADDPDVTSAAPGREWISIDPERG